MPMVPAAHPFGALDARRLRTQVPLAPYTTFRIGGPAEWFYEATSADDLAAAVTTARAAGIPWFVLGLGANILVGDRGVPGLVIRNAAAAHTLSDTGVLWTESGAVVQDLVLDTVRAGWSGLEHYIGIPSTIGGALWQNLHFLSPAPERDRTMFISEVFTDCDILAEDGARHTVDASYINFGYDDTVFHHRRDIVLSARFRLTADDPARLHRVLQENLSWRGSRHPWLQVHPSAGSVFKKIEGIGAGRLIDQCGLKGYRVGDAQISHIHANILVNLGHATAADVRALIAHAQQTVAERLGYHLETEIGMIGEFRSGPDGPIGAQRGLLVTGVQARIANSLATGNPVATACVEVEVNPIPSTHSVVLRRYFLPAVALLLLVTAAPPAVAQTVDVIRGRITGANAEPLEGVSILVTSISGNVNRPARTDGNGRFTVTFPNGDGDYMVTVTAVGYALKRFEVKRVADEDVLLADARLTPVGTVLDAMRVTADRQRVSRNETQQDVGGTERTISNMAALPPDQLGDLAAMAATLPGVQLVPGQDGTNGYSVMGLGADQNNTTLNGMNFGGAGLPRDAGVSSSLITSPYDVARGGFSGGQFSLRTRSGTNFRNRGLSFLGDAPQLQWMDAAARATGQQFVNGSLGGSVSGPLVFDKAFYNVAFQVGRRSNDLQTLLNMTPTGLQASGVARDSVQRLMHILGSNAVPVNANGIPGSRLSDQGSLVGAFDFAPPTSTSGTAFNLTFNGAWNRQSPASSLTTAMPNAGGERTGWNGGVQGRHSAYLTLGDINVLTETSVGFTAGTTSGSPYLDLPSGRVRVNSAFADGTFGLQNLAFGGNQQLATSQASNSLMAMNTLSWFSADNKHRLKLTSEIRRDGSTQDQTLNRLGTYTYNSLADLEAGLPVSFTRTLSPRERNADMLIGALSLGDSYRYSPTLQIQYGLRVDGNRFLDVPAPNAALHDRLGVRNDRAPNGLYLSPRVGFSWQYGTAPQIGGFEGAFRGPRAVVRGGIGVFQNMPQSTLVGGAIDNTGLPTAIQQLACVGDAVPMPNWSAYGNPDNIPTRCADGSTGVFNNAVPNVNLFNDAFMPARSVRSNLSWSGPILFNRVNGSFDAAYSLNLNQASFIDRNFAGAERFTLDAEGGRPVYVLPGSIVPSTGGIAAGDGRKVAEYQRVTEQMSDLTSRSAQFTVRLSPMQFNSKFSWNASYTYGNVREEFRGFQSTTGNPFDVHTSRSSFDSRHQITYGFNWNAFDLVRLSWFGQFRAGTPFTPGIGSDVNGDGYANDRAFVFNPASAPDATLASQMNTLLANGSAVARRCLERQLGTLAARNSCQGPWVSSANLSVSFNPLKLRLPQRANLTFNVSNPLGAADLLINGEDNLRGWGQQIFTDPTLLYVRGFDPVTRQYKYEVNQRFGATNPQFQQFRAPVSVSMMLRYDIGPTRERQLLTQSLDRGRRTEGNKAPEALIKAQFGNGGVPNPLATILRDQDTLRLSADQADSLASMNRRYMVRLDSIWAPISRQFAELPDGYDRDRVYWQYVKARETSIDILRAYAPAVKKLLSVEQRRKLPPFITTALDDRYLKSIRSGTAGGGGNAFAGAGGGGPVFMGSSGMAAGSSQTIIVR